MRITFQNPVIKGDMDYVYERISSEKINNSRFLVTGASGMIAAYIVSFLIYLAEEKQFDIIIDVAIRNKKKAFEMFGERNCINYISYDANSRNNFENRYDYIIHAASLASPQYYGSKPVETMLPNIVGLNELLMKAKDDGSKMIFLSSGSVYGDVDGVDIITEEAYGQFDYLSQGNVYGESKRCGEALCLSYHREYDLPVAIARIHHSYGPTMDYVNDNRVFSEFVKNVINHENIEMKSDGLAKRPFCYMSDLLIQLMTIIIKGNGGEIFNVGNPYELVQIRELAEIIGKIAEPELKVKMKEREDTSYCQEKIRHDTNFSIEKIQKLSGYKPTITIEEGFKRTIKAIMIDLKPCE